MDFVTHALAGCGAARLLAHERRQVPQLMPAALIGSLLPDFDSWLALGGLDLYGRYHRVITHAALSLGAIGLAGGLLAWWLAGWRGISRFGWFVAPNLNQPAVRLPLKYFLLAGCSAVALHWLGDWITGFGNIQPFWPWSTWDPSLRAVQSFDPFIFALTFAWHLTVRTHPGRSGLYSRATEAGLFIGWLGIVAIYVCLRLVLGPRTII